MQRKTIEDYCWNLIDRFDIKVASGKDPITFLSGGNMQKVIIARELDANPTLLVAGQPTRGVDVGAIEFIHTQLIAMRDEGVGILLVSSEIDEILSLSDRIYVLYEGEIAGNLVNENINEVELGLIMTGSIQKVAGTSP
jgi:simple sugar transport system ATP-binding protein